MFVPSMICVYTSMVWSLPGLMPRLGPLQTRSRPRGRLQEAHTACTAICLSNCLKKKWIVCLSVLVFISYAKRSPSSLHLMLFLGCSHIQMNAVLICIYFMKNFMFIYLSSNWYSCRHVTMMSPRNILTVQVLGRENWIDLFIAGFRLTLECVFISNCDHCFLKEREWLPFTR